jgi:hypothetical protein
MAEYFLGVQLQTKEMASSRKKDFFIEIKLGSIAKHNRNLAVGRRAKIVEKLGAQAESGYRAANLMRYYPSIPIT